MQYSLFSTVAFAAPFSTKFYSELLFRSAQATHSHTMESTCSSPLRRTCTPTVYCKTTSPVRPLVIPIIRTHGKGGTGSDQLSIDLIDGAAAVCYVTSKELKYMMVQSWGVGVGKRVMP